MIMRNLGAELEAADGASDAAAAMMALIMAHAAGVDSGRAAGGHGGEVAEGRTERELVGEALARRTAERDLEVMRIRNRLMARAEADRALARDMRQAAAISRNNSKALPANFGTHTLQHCQSAGVQYFEARLSSDLRAPTVHKKKEADNQRARANIHHGNAHYNFSGSKQFQKGVRVKGIVQRKAKSGGKQAAAAKAAKGKKSSSGAAKGS
jgi:hypothetical protein